MIKFFLEFCTNIIILILFILSLSISLVYSSELKNYDGNLNNYLMYCNKPKWDSLKKTYDYNLYKLTEYVTISKYTLQKRERGKWISFCKEIEFYKQTAICSKDYKFTKNDPTLFFLQRIRDESHRFAISAHRAKRKKGLSKSLLDQIDGIGAIRKRALLNHFGSARSVESASLDEIKSVDGVEEKVAKKIYNFFHE